jgi:predicted ABC-type ATPase
LSRFVGTGYAVRLLYLWLPNADLAVARVRVRVRHGGHDVPEDVIRRRFERSLHNFWFLYRPLATTWQVFDASSANVRAIVARGAGSGAPTVVDAERWNRLLQQVTRSDVSGGREYERP